MTKSETFLLYSFFFQLVSVLHYGEEFRRLNELIGFCEMIMETWLQLTFQIWIENVYYMLTRQNSAHTVLFFLKAYIMISFHLTKTLMPPAAGSKNNQIISRIKAFWWALTLSLLIMFCVGWDFCRFNLLFAYRPLSVFLYCTIPFLLYLSFCAIFLYKNCFNRSKQTKLKCLLASIFFLGLSVFWCFIIFVDGHHSKLGLIYYIPVLIIHLYLTSIFTKASFTVSSLVDIWSLEQISSKSKTLQYLLLFCSTFLVFVFVSAVTFGFVLEWKDIMTW